MDKHKKQQRGNKEKGKTNNSEKWGRINNGKDDEHIKTYEK